MTAAYRAKLISKKSAVTILTRLDTMSGRLAVSAIKPAAMTKASVAAGLKPNANSMAMTMGVQIKAAPTLAQNADTAAPSNTISAKIGRATCRERVRQYVSDSVVGVS